VPVTETSQTMCQKGIRSCGAEGVKFLNSLCIWRRTKLRPHEPSSNLSEPCFVQAPMVPAVASCHADQRFTGDAQALSQQFMEIVEACKRVHQGASCKVGTLRITCVQRTSSTSAWWGQVANCPVMFSCADALLNTNAPMEAVIRSLYSVEERLKWDRSFSAFEVLGTASTHAVTGDVIYCRMPLPRGMADRDAVQERFLMPVPGGGYAIVMQSCSAHSAAALGRPAGAAGLVRATTILSGYLVMPESHGQLRIVALSQTDVGGKVPQRAQSLLLSLGRHQLKEWVRRLDAHCNQCSNSISTLPNLEKNCSRAPFNADVEQSMHIGRKAWAAFTSLSKHSIAAAHVLYVATTLLVAALTSVHTLIRAPRTKKAECSVAAPLIKIQSQQKAKPWLAPLHGLHARPRLYDCVAIVGKVLDLPHVFFFE